MFKEQNETLFSTRQLDNDYENIPLRTRKAIISSPPAKLKVAATVAPKESYNSTINDGNYNDVYNSNDQNQKSFSPEHSSSNYSLSSIINANHRPSSSVSINNNSSGSSSRNGNKNNSSLPSSPNRINIIGVSNISSMTPLPTYTTPLQILYFQHKQQKMKNRNDTPNHYHRANNTNNSTTNQANTSRSLGNHYLQNGCSSLLYNDTTEAMLRQKIKENPLSNIESATTDLIFNNAAYKSNESKTFYNNNPSGIESPTQFDTYEGNTVDELHNASPSTPYWLSNNLLTKHLSNNSKFNY